MIEGRNSEGKKGELQVQIKRLEKGGTNTGGRDLTQETKASHQTNYFTKLPCPTRHVFTNPPS
jgi:hypothetical protein